MTASGEELYTLVFKPIFKELVWGGMRLRSELEKAAPEGRPIGESWELVDLPEAQSVVAEGALAGVELQQLVRDYRRSLLGPVATDGDRFPLLVKYIDAARTLSVQVHPDEETAARLDGRAKSEAWYILGAEPGAKLYLGLAPGTAREDLERALSAGGVAQLLSVVEPSPGELVPVPPGTVHAIGEGILLAEVQQPSDTTYRIYDWDRVGLDGRPRQLHVAAALQAIRFDARVEIGSRSYDAGRFNIRISGSFADEADAAGPLVLVGLGGEGRVADRAGRSAELRRGVVALVPHGCRPATVEGDHDLETLAVTFPTEGTTDG